MYWRIAQGQIETRRSQVMAKQRAIAQTLGPQILPFREQVEGWVRELAANFPGDFVDPSASLDKISTSPGVYFRLRTANTGSVKANPRGRACLAPRWFSPPACSCAWARAIRPKGPPAA